MGKHRIMNTAVMMAIAPLTWLVSRFWWTCDDAFISFRYVKHLVRGDGLTFNPGETPPVEGFTNLLWILALAPFQAQGVPLPVLANVISAACVLVLLALIVQFQLRRGMELWSSGATALVFVTLPPVAIWSTSGLETMPFTLAVFATYMVLTLGKGRARIALALALAMVVSLLRADGALWCGFAFIASLLSCPLGELFSREQRSAQRKAVLTTGVLLTVGVACHFAWRYSYFGEWLPNTAKIKAGFTLIRAERGLKYLASLVLAVPVLALIPLLALPFLRRMAKHAGFGLGALSFLVLASVYTIYVGGDFMAMGRLMVPALPFLILIFGATVKALDNRTATLVFSSAFVALGLLGCLGRLDGNADWRQALHFRWNREKARTEVEQWQFMTREVEDNSRLGRALAKHALPGEKLVRGNVGAVGFYCELVLLDINGLVIPEVATAAKPLVRASPGHDRRVASSFFNDWEPDYQFATILPSAMAPRLGFGERWKAMLKRGKLELERIPLDAEEGFAPGTELRLLRDLRWGEKPAKETQR